MAKLIGVFMKSLRNISIEKWEEEIPEKIQLESIQALEGGKILFLPHLSFDLGKKELPFLRPDIVDPKTKNISYDIRNDLLSGAKLNKEDSKIVQEMVKRYATLTQQFLKKLLPHYTSHIRQARTSLRTVEIAGRKSSYRKDDTLLHVDAFPSSPTKGERILRVFTNVNPEEPRVWRAGDSFENVVKKFAPLISPPLPGSLFFLKLFGITKGSRTPYDHYMLHIHDRMKGDSHYQKTVPQEEIHFPPGSSWICWTDQVSHAAMKGQHVLEQTFHLPVHGLKDSSTSPLKVLERFFGRPLI